jgi:hypothetical protein
LNIPLKETPDQKIKRLEKQVAELTNEWKDACALAQKYKDQRRLVTQFLKDAMQTLECIEGQRAGVMTPTPKIDPDEILIKWNEFRSGQEFL